MNKVKHLTYRAAYRIVQGMSMFILQHGRTWLYDHRDWYEGKTHLFADEYRGADYS